MTTPPRRPAPAPFSILISLFLMIFGVTFLLEGVFEPALIFLIVGGLMFFSQVQQTRQLTGSSAGMKNDAPKRPPVPPARTQTTAPPDAAPRADGQYTHALDAAAAAGINPETAAVVPLDLGLLSFTGADQPQIHRVRPVSENVDYVQPFVILKLPTRAAGRIRFEISDADDQVVFVHEEIHDMQAGRTLVTPAARLPIHDARNFNGAWELAISADGVPIARHRFSWAESQHKRLRRHIAQDGELSNELRTLLDERPLGEMSLDELLEAQSKPGAARKR